MCATSSILLGWARRASGQAVLAAMLGSVLASFVIVAVAMVLMARLWPEILPAGALTAVVVYLAYRFVEASGASGHGLRPVHGPRLGSAGRSGSGS